MWHRNGLTSFHMLLVHKVMLFIIPFAQQSIGHCLYMFSVNIIFTDAHSICPFFLSSCIGDLGEFFAGDA